MSLIPFDVKYVSLIDDPVRGYSALHPDAKAILDHICHACQENGWKRPLVTEFGRTKDDMEKYYLPGLLQELEHDGRAYDLVAVEEARQKARARFSWHCVDRAFDLRDWIYTDAQRGEILDSVRRAFPAAEALDHALVGGARHFHFAAPDPAGKPKDWV